MTNSIFSLDDDGPIVTASSTLAEIVASPLPTTESALDYQRNRLSQMISNARYAGQYDALSADEIAQANGRIEAIDVAIKPLSEARRFAEFARVGRDRGWPELAVRNALMPDLDMTGPTMAAAQEFVDDREHWFLILGGNIGVGKTTAAAWIAATLHSKYRETTRFITAAAFARSSKYDDARDELLKERALCIDDMGAEYIDAKGNAQADVDELVNTFYAGRRTLIITTNLRFPTPAARDKAKASSTEVTFQCRYGIRAADRLREAGRWILDTSPSKRRPQ